MSCHNQSLGLCPDVMSCHNSHLAFVLTEAWAAKGAGLGVVLSVREGTAPLTPEDLAAFPTITSFRQLLEDDDHSSSSTKQGRREQEEEKKKKQGPEEGDKEKGREN